MRRRMSREPRSIAQARREELLNRKTQMKSRILRRRICRTWMITGIKNSQKITIIRQSQRPMLPFSRWRISLSQTRSRIQWYSWRTPRRRRGHRRTKSIPSKATARTPLRTPRRNGNKTHHKRLKAICSKRKQRMESQQCCPLKTTPAKPSEPEEPDNSWIRW